MASGEGLKIVMFLGTVREGRHGIKVAKFMKQQLEKTGHEVTLFDPLELDFPLLKKPLQFYKDRSEAPALLLECDQKVQEADGFVIVSGEYNNSIPPPLSNMMDHFPLPSYGYKPSGIVCYSMGMFGGIRAAMQLRALLGELGCISVSNIFAIPRVHEAFDDEGVPKNDHMERGADRLVAQLDWMAHAMKNHRAKHGVPK